MEALNRTRGDAPSSAGHGAHELRGLAGRIGADTGEADRTPRRSTQQRGERERGGHGEDEGEEADCMLRATRRTPGSKSSSATSGTDVAVCIP